MALEINHFNMDEAQNDSKFYKIITMKLYFQLRCNLSNVTRYDTLWDTLQSADVGRTQSYFAHMAIVSLVSIAFRNLTPKR